ncbi:FecR family protein [Microbulbifer hainanensis]|uniref:FecR family protein n=1 Tax=Microbulbifer hainanensis TaxID=2735675 RepID=UPI0018672B38|nr:FecR family protein [Microbulbifer hainanensis]
MKSADIEQTASEEALDQACAWIARLRSDAVSAADRREFSAWMTASTGNQQAFEEMSELWGDLGALAHMPIDELFPESRPSTRTATKRSTAQSTPAYSDTAVASHGWNLSQWLMGGGLVAACLMVTLWVGNLWMSNNQLGEQVYATNVGETRTVTLSDGSQIELNTNTELRVAYTRNERHTRLLRGEAYFQVARQTSRPFTVAAGKANIRVLGTKFNIERNPESTRVSVTHGVVAVSEAQSAPGLRPDSVKLVKDQKVSVSNTGLGRVSHTSTEEAIDWTRGVLVFEQTPLAEALEELNRYLQTPAKADNTVRERALSGTFELSDPEHTLSAIAAALDLEEDHSDPNLTLLSPKPN